MRLRGEWRGRWDLGGSGEEEGGKGVHGELIWGCEHDPI